MKYLIVVAISAFGGFVGAWLLFNTMTTTPVMVESNSLARDASPAPVRPGSGSRRTSSNPGHPAPLTFEDIGASSTVFRQQLTAWQLAAQTDEIVTLEDLIDRCLDELDPLYRTVIASVLMERYIELDPVAAMAYVDKEYRLDRDAMQAHVLTSWVRYDPQAALDYFRQISDQRLKTNIGAMLLQDPVLASTGLVSEVELILGSRAGQIRERIELQQADPTILFESALSMTGGQRQTRMMYAVNRWVEIDPEAALERIRNLDRGTEQQTMLQVAVSRYAQRDPEAALDWAQLYQPENVQLQTRIVGIMAQHDIDRALIVAEDIARRSGDDNVLSTVVNTWGQNDPAAALAYIETLPSSQRQNLYLNLVHAYVRKYPRQGLNWALGLGPEYDAVKLSALGAITSDNVDIVEQALPGTTNTQTRGRFITAISNFKAAQDPDEALTWLQSLPEGDLKRDATHQLAFAMLRRQPDRVEEIIAELEITGEAAERIRLAARNRQ
ncbi:MAG: hypothetical protein WD002_08495 [Pseudomonadales bacterium]